MAEAVVEAVAEAVTVDEAEAVAGPCEGPGAEEGLGWFWGGLCVRMKGR